MRTPSFAKAINTLEASEMNTPPVAIVAIALPGRADDIAMEDTKVKTPRGTIATSMEPCVIAYVASGKSHGISISRTPNTNNTIPSINLQLHREPNKWTVTLLNTQ